MRLSSEGTFTVFELKTCTKCGEEKPRSEFNKRQDAKDGLRGYCRTCHVANSTAWVAANGERFNERIRNDRAVNPEKYRARERKSQAREYYRQRQKIRTNLRRKRLRQATPTWVDQESIRGVYEAAASLTRGFGVDYHVDHIVPLRSKLVCGLHVRDNLRVVLAEVNLRKSNRRWPDMPEG